ncbi:MAG: hypothetical protein ACREPE_02725 [Lysobacter sp.]
MGRRDQVIAATMALGLNGLIAWQLQALLSPRRMAMAGEDASPQVVWIEALPPRRVAAAVAVRQPASTSRAAPLRTRPVETRAQRDKTSAPVAAAPPPARPMAAVYLHQARQWAAQRPEGAVPADPFANRPVALAQQPASRFRLAQRSPADAVAKIGKLFGGAGYTTDDCGAIDDRLLGLVVGGDTRAVQQDLDYERRNCRR